jgi:hypothetical protein
MKENQEQNPSSAAFEPPLTSNGFDEDSSTREAAQIRTSQNKKKPYAKPSFRYERVFETMALHCGKIERTNPNCQFNRHTS